MPIRWDRRIQVKIRITAENLPTLAVHLDIHRSAPQTPEHTADAHHERYNKHVRKNDILSRSAALSLEVPFDRVSDVRSSLPIPRHVQPEDCWEAQAKPGSDESTDEAEEACEERDDVGKDES